MKSRKTKASGGRPPKFSELRRPITVTLPERVLRALESVNSDRARAIVKCVEAVVGRGEHAAKPVELVEVMPGKALIVIGPCKSLSKISWLRLVEIAPARYLLVFPSGKSAESLELEIMDLLENLDDPDNVERALMDELRKLISHHRRGQRVSKQELVFVDI
jgi:hypothetical protein